MSLEPREVPLSPGFLERAAAAVRYARTGDSGQWNIWFGPGAPPTPQQPEVGGRQMDFQTAINMQWQPRVGEPIGFQTLRDLADGYDLLRLVIETRKDQLAKLEWTIKPRDKKAKPDARCEEIQTFLQKPDRIHGWDQWNRMFWEEVMVPDALTILPRRTLGGDPFALDIIDGTTIKPILGVDGRRPLEGPAFQQVIKGIPVADFTDQDLYYRPHNVRAHKIYGYSKVEQVLTTVNIALRRQIYQLQYYTEGSAPDMIFSVPETWNPNQIKAFAEWWWSQLSNGNTAQKRKGMFVPAGVKPIDVKEQALKDLYDEWLARIICYCFSVPPQALVKEQSRATASTQKDMSKEEGILPMMTFQKGIMDGLLADFFEAPDLQFAWAQEAATSPEDQAKIDASDVAAGIRLVNEVRADRGLEPLPEPEPDVLPEGAALPTGERPQDTALNGPQIASLLLVVQAAVGGSIPKASAEPMIRACFPSLPTETVAAMISAIPDEPKKPEPVIPPPPPGNAPKPEGQDAAPAAPASTDEQPSGAGEPAKKLAKAKKPIKPIKRQRPLVMKLQARIEKTVAGYLKGSIHNIAGEIHAALPSEKLAKMSQDEARQILESLGLDFSDLGDDLEPLLAAIAADGGMQALSQLGITESSIVDQVNEDAVAWAKQHAADLVTQLAETTREKIQSDLVASIESGMSVDEIAGSLASTYGFSDERAHLVAQTERAFADVAGNRKAYAASGVVGSIEWSCANGGDGVEGSDSPCPECEQNDGQTVPLGKDGEATEPFPSGDTTVPAHPGCFISGTVVSAVGVSKHFKRWFAGEVVTLSIEGNDDLTATPNHPILTRRGWVAAAELQQGDEVVKCLDPGAAVALLGPDDHHIETHIEKMADALAVTSRVSSARVPTTTEDFHGDGLIDQDVDVVWTEGRLRSKGEPIPSASDGVHELHLKRRLVADPLGSGARTTYPQTDRLDLAPDSGMSGLCAPRALDGADSLSLHQSSLMEGADAPPIAAENVADGQVVAAVPGRDARGGLTALVGRADSRNLAIREAPLQSLGLPTASNRDSVFREDAHDDLLGDSHLLRELLSRNPGLVTMAKVIGVTRNKFAGHVFNLQTVGGWYFANSIIAHNCFCDLLPVINDEDTSEE